MPCVPLTPNSTSAGMRYTNAGSTCMVSRTGRTTASKRSLKAANMPIGTPTATAKIADTTRTLIVTIAESQNPIRPMNSAPAPENSPSRQPPSLSPRIVPAATTTGQGSHSRNASIPASPASMTSEIGSKNQAKLSPTHSKKPSIGSWMGSSQLPGQLPKSVPALAVDREYART